MFLKTEKKKLLFQKNTDTCGKDFNLINPRVLTRFAREDVGLCPFYGSTVNE